MRRKTIGFRPKENVEQYVKSEIEQDPTKTKSDVLNDLCELGLSRISRTGPQIEGPPSPSTGILVKCELRRVPVPLYSDTVFWRPPVDSSVCNTCHKYPCETWEQIFAERRLNPDSPDVKRIDVAHS